MTWSIARRTAPAVGFAAVAIAVALPLAAMSAAPAGADIKGPCEGSIAGQSARGRSASDPADAISVAEDATIPVSMQSPGGLESHDLVLEYAGFQWTVSSESDEGQTTADDEIDVGDYAIVGAGLYKVIGRAQLVDGSTCEGAVLVDVQGNPLTTAAGVVAAVVGALGVAGLAGATASAWSKAAGEAATTAGTAP